MAATNVLNFYIDYPGAVTQKLSSEVADSQLVNIGAKGKKWRNRIINEQSDLVFPYAWFFFSRPDESYGYSRATIAEADYIKTFKPEYLLHAKDCRMTSVVTDETTIFGVWEV